VKSLTEIVVIIDKEEALQTKEVIGEVAEIVDLVQKIKGLLKTMEDSSFRSNIKNGKKWKAELLTLTTSITNAKGTLMLKIGSANVGLIQLTHNKYAVQMEKLENVESQLNKLVDNFGCLEISEVVRRRRREGTWHSQGCIL
jgi:hypothetical protein